MSINSVPSGAIVLDAEAEKKIGLTPWSTTLDSRDKDLWLILRKDGYRDRLVRVNLRHDSERSEKLSRDLTRSRKPASHEVVEDLQKKLKAAPEQTIHVDLPTYKSPHIVD